MHDNATFCSGAHDVGIKQIDGKVEVCFLNVNYGTPETLTAALVIVADGSSSAVRSWLLSNIKREYTGYMCWRGTRSELMKSETNCTPGKRRLTF